MTAIPVILLKPGVPHRVLKGHFWIYNTELATIEGQPADGDVVDVFDPRRHFIARGYYNSQSQIAVRVLARRQADINETFWRERLEQAIRYREECLPSRQARRLVSSEADLLPGLIVDQYGDQLVLQTTTLGMDRRKEMWVNMLNACLRPKAILENNDISTRRQDGLELRKGVLSGQSDGNVRVKIGQIEFICNLLDAHKTGFYLDQQINYERVSKFVKPRMRVLDAFCHLAGFARHALLAGAAEAIAVDSSEASINYAKQSAAMAGTTGQLTFCRENAFDYLRAAQKRRDAFDLIILDPPSFTRSRRATPEALRGYKEIHVRAMKLLKTGGILATFCCSHHVGRDIFQNAILDAAADTGTLLRRETILDASPDHPILPAVPETEYLKGFVFTVVGTGD